ncbi:hypothetical protein GQ44DRAFT_827389 [Phaeosphaeriaceae sp. PMI808]|nr:hypothetical protein GQ44DRAFT_827389 [Phaeosphaeriaceae sp. PMI808]
MIVANAHIQASWSSPVSMTLPSMQACKIYLATGGQRAHPTSEDHATSHGEPEECCLSRFQRVALIRHNLHAARRTNDFSFSETLQAHALIEGTDHVTLLQSTLGDNADHILLTLDSLNAGIAYVHQDAFKAVYDSIKSAMHNDQPLTNRKSLLRVDMADHAIDKTTNSTINFIQSQPTHCQNIMANAWITGTTIIADAVSVCLNEMITLEDNLDDFILLEYSWNCIQSSVDSAIAALRGIFSLMNAFNMKVDTSSITNHPSQGLFGRNLSISSATGSEHGSNAIMQSRSLSTASALGFTKRALSVSQQSSSSKAARQGSIAIPVPKTNHRGFRAGMSLACPTKMPTFGDFLHTTLATIPPTPATGEGNLLRPFKDTDDYFAVGDVDTGCKTSVADDMMQLYVFQAA